MNWADAVNDISVLTSSELISSNAAVMPRETSTSWEPHEVWLTRVKLPRDRAALRLAEKRSRRVGP